MNTINGTEISEESSFEEYQRWQLSVLRQKEAECKRLQDTIQDGQSHTDLDGCSPAWDKIVCWPRARAGEIVSVPCPDYVHKFNWNENATRYCTEHGQWFVHPITNKTWSNYSQCHNSSESVPEGEILVQDSLITEWLPVIKKISQVGYSLSLCTLIIAFIILISIKKLRCPRNTLHMHLFVSFMLRAFMALLKDSLFIDGVGLSQSIVDGIFVQEQSNWACKLMVTLWQYFIVANYSWILMEGLYLHNLIFLAPFSDSSAITLYVAMGWGFPIPVILSWVLCRVHFDDTLCWTTHHNNSNLFLIVRIPIIITIVLNFLFFLNITRVLLVKLQSAVSIETRKYRYRKWAKSTLVLVPLFGVHYMLLLAFSAVENPRVEVTWLLCDQLFASHQGFCVAILYCLLNGEVRSEITKKWRGWRSESDSKNVWVPLHHINSRLNNHRSTQEMGMSGTSMAGVLSNCTVKQPLTDNFKEKRLEREVTEEHRIEIIQGD